MSASPRLPPSQITPLSPTASHFSRESSKNLAVLPTNTLITIITEELRDKFDDDVAKAFEDYIRENEFDLESLREDLEQPDDSFLISEIAEQFGWDTNTQEQSRFKLTIANILDPQITDLTRMKSVISRNDIPSELLVYGYLRNLEDEQAKSYEMDGDEEEEEEDDEDDDNDRLIINNGLLTPPSMELVYQRSIMTNIPDGVMKLCVRFFQNITVYGVGRNDRGEFGIPGKNNFMALTELSWINTDSDFILSSIIPCTINGIAYISHERDLWICGFNKYGQFGLNHCENVVEIPVQHPFYKQKGLKIEDVSHGKRAYHMFVTTTNGNIYAHGANEWGQCGINRQIPKEMEPVLLDTKSFIVDKTHSTITDISCGIEHSIFLASTGKIYSCGHNKWGQLGFKNHGYDRINELLVPKLINTFAFDDDDDNRNSSNLIIKQITCGDSNSYCIDTNGNLWAWGRNEFGELGCGDRTIRLRWQPKQIKYFRRNNVKIFKICCGSDHVLVLDVFGKIYSWGFGKYGCCGDGSSMHRYYPQQIKALDRYNIVDISCGSTHSIAVSDQRDIWSWGYNTLNQCCIDTFDPNKWFNTCKEIKIPRMVNTAITKLLSGMNDVIGVRTATNSTLFIVEPKIIPT